MGKVAIIVLRSAGRIPGPGGNEALERELQQILSGEEFDKRIPRCWILEKITVLDA